MVPESVILPGSQGTSTTTPANGTLNGTKIIGYVVAGGILLLAGGVVPDIAIATTGLIFLAVLLTHANQLNAIGDFIKSSTGG